MHDDEFFVAPDGRLFLRGYRRPVQHVSKDLADNWTVENAPELCSRVEGATGNSVTLRRVAGESGIVPPLLCVLQHGDCAAQTAAARLTAHLCANHPTNMATFGRSGFVEGCATLARSTGDAAVRSAAAQALSALLGPPTSVATSINRQRAHRAGAVDALRTIRDDATCSVAGRQAANAAIEHLALHHARRPRLSWKIARWSGHGQCGLYEGAAVPSAQPVATGVHSSPVVIGQAAQWHMPSRQALTDRI